MKAASAFGIRSLLRVVVASLVICSNHECAGFQTQTTTGIISNDLHQHYGSLLHSMQRGGGSVQLQRTFAAARTKTTTITTTPTTTRLLFSSASDDASLSTKAELDVDAIVKYGGALVIQLGIVFSLFTGLDALVAYFKLQQQVPFAVNFVLFYVFALKSRVFNPLANTRPKPSTLEIEAADDNKVTIRPSWTPPGFIFPIMWLLIIGPIRAVTSAMVYATTGSYACWPILALMLHLGIGDVWNTINNVERRYGASVSGVFLVWLSKAHAAYQYMQVDDGLAGKILAITLVWLTIASALITRTWQLNPDPTTGKVEPLYPVKGKVKTRYIWFQ
jgi:translocator protein